MIEEKARELLRAVESQEWARASKLADDVSAELESKVGQMRRDLGVRVEAVARAMLGIDGRRSA